jgi:hypothetical protein
MRKSPRVDLSCIRTGNYRRRSTRSNPREFPCMSWSRWKLARCKRHRPHREDVIVHEGRDRDPVVISRRRRKRLTHQYLLTFPAKTPKKGYWQRIRLMTEVPNADLVGPGKVWVTP